MKYFSKEDALTFVNNIPILNDGVSYANQIKTLAKSDKTNWLAIFVPPILVGGIVLLIKKLVELNLEKKKKLKLGENHTNAGFP